MAAVIRFSFLQVLWEIGINHLEKISSPKVVATIYCGINHYVLNHQCFSFALKGGSTAICSDVYLGRLNFLQRKFFQRQ